MYVRISDPRHTESSNITGARRDTMDTMCRTSCVQVHELPQSHCGDKRDSTLLSWLHIYVHIYIYIYVCVHVF